MAQARVSALSVTMPLRFARPATYRKHPYAIAGNPIFGNKGWHHSLQYLNFMWQQKALHLVTMFWADRGAVLANKFGDLSQRTSLLGVQDAISHSCLFMLKDVFLVRRSLTKFAGRSEVLADARLPGAPHYARAGRARLTRLALHHFSATPFRGQKPRWHLTAGGALLDLYSARTLRHNCGRLNRSPTRRGRIAPARDTLLRDDDHRVRSRLFLLLPLREHTLSGCHPWMR
jgi:hypothetical protein